VKPARTTAALAVAAALAVPAAAQAHVTLQPGSAPAGGFVRLDVRVPNERSGVDTTKVDLQLPGGFAEASYEPVPGWKVKVTKAKLATPVKTDDGEVTEEVARITWSGGRIPPGAFQDFGLSVQVPGKAGDALTFKALQTYGDGQVVRWIGPAGSDAPAPVVHVVGAAGATAATPAAATARPATRQVAESSSDTLPVIAIVVGTLGLAAGIAALAGSRRTPAAR
jgi:uncharacterized protein YcnI